PDETIGSALRKMGVRDIGRLPVVDPRNSRKMVGMLRRTEVVQAYDAALSKRAGLRHKARQVRIGEIGRVDVHEITIESGASCVGQTVSQIAWPRDCVIASIQRKGRLLIPRGDTTLQVGDILAVVAEEGEAIAKVREICQRETDGMRKS
ncbi:MAG: TrkA C-terminal domain-containing protein, partial [Candidatus Kapaibacterium sp.]